ncbi:hypothetical protein ACFZCY_40535 [Streptomyces sp. NPDC007983]|uniref:hypothetical protein n=1 Tax=Streptomyces sp. NPDC007983 TaxID=3364800 RepID=UPI0036E61A95
MIDHRDDRRDVAAELREAAEAHQPDRTRMLARVTAGMAADERRRVRRAPGRQWARLVGPAAGLAAAVAAAGIAVVTTDTADGPQTVRTSSEPAGPPAGRGGDTTKRPGGGAGDGAGRHTPSAFPTAVGPNHLADPAVRSQGAINPNSNPYWAQSDISLTTSKPLTSLTVELRVAENGGVRTTGSFSTVHTGDLATSVRSEDGVLVYRWTLRKGATVPAGRYVFAGQYNHAEGSRDAGRDGYSATGHGPSGAFAVRGDFRR